MIEKIQSTNPELAKIIKECGGFITIEQLPQLIEIDRHMLVMVRCGNGRFITPVDSVQHFTNIITEHNGDYVRDVSIMHNVIIQ